MARAAILFFVIVCFFALSAQAAPRWPLQWQSEFNFVNVSNRALLNYGMYYYKSDGRVTQLRIDNVNCPAGGRSFSCRVVFAKDGNCYLWAPEHNNLCCLLYPGLKATSPGWLSNATYLGVREYQHRKTVAWLNTPLTDIYYQTPIDSTPVALGDSSSVIEWNGFQVIRQDQNLFSLPSGCNKACPALMAQAEELQKLPGVSLSPQ